LSKVPTGIIDLKDFLDSKVEQFNRPDFIKNDPISIPHLYKKKQDIEIAGLFAAVLAWGQRGTIINKTKELMALMENTPHDFLLLQAAKDLRRFEKFAHRTFNGADAVVPYLISEGENHESYNDRPSHRIRSPEHVGARTRWNALWKPRHAPFRKPCRNGTYRERTQKYFGKYAWSHRARSAWPRTATLAGLSSHRTR